jgi:hypothetical protein
MTLGQILLSYMPHKLKLQTFNKSRAITLTKQNKSTSKTPGAQLHMLRAINESRAITLTRGPRWPEIAHLTHQTHLINYLRQAS